MQRGLICWRKAQGLAIGLGRARNLGSLAASELHLELDDIDRKGIKATPTIYIALIRKCTNVSEAKRLHRHILGSLHSQDRLLLNLLVESYGKCGSLADARALFNRIEPKNVFSWTIMVAAYAQDGHMQEAMQIFQEMLLDGEKPDKVGFLKALEVCSSLQQGRKIHELIGDAGLGKATCLGNALMNMYGKSGCLDQAEMVFKNMISKDVVSWNTMIRIHTKLSDGEAAFDLFQQMVDSVKPDRVTYISILQACDPEQGEQIHERIIEDGLESDVVVGNALINMYGTRGALHKAREVFDRMQNKDVVSWNVMIGAYTHHGHSRNALEMFSRMQLECVAPDEVTFVSVLNAAAGSEELKMIRERVAAGGFDSNIFIGNSLVHLHGKWGSVDEAKQLFDAMSLRNVSSWNSIVDAYVQNGFGSEALCLFRKMQLEGFKPDKVTFLTVLEIATLSFGRFIHELIAASGLQTDVLLQTSLLQMYAKNSSLEESKMVFHGIRNRDLFAWNSLLTACAQEGAGEEAIQIFHRMNLEGVNPSEQTFVSVIDSCATLMELQQGEKIHNCAVECGVESSLSVGNTLINMYGKCSSLEKARAIFDRMVEKNLISWNALAAAYVQHGDGLEALQLLCLMQLEGTKPDRITFFSCLDACLDLAAAKMVHAQITSFGFDSDIAVANSLINTYRKCQSLEDSELVFRKMKNRDVVSWTSMLYTYLEAGYGKEAMEIWCSMNLHGDKPDSVTFARALEACGNLSCLARGQAIYDHIKLSGYGADPSVLPAVIAMYSGCNWLEEAAQVFSSADFKDVLLCNAMIAAFSEHGYGRKCVELFRRMDIEGVNPNRATFNTMLDVCAGLANLALARTIHSSIIDSGFQSDVIVDNTIINMYGKCGSLRDARRAFDSMQERALVSWNTIIAVTAQHGEDSEARKLFRKLQQEGFKPDNVALMSVASACQHVGLLEEAFYYLFHLATEYGVKPKTERYSCIIGLLGKIGWLDEAEAVIRKMPFQPNEAVWKNLLIACKIHDDVARGARVAKELWKLDSDDAATYISLYNMYARGEKAKPNDGCIADEQAPLQTTSLKLGDRRRSGEEKCSEMKSYAQLFSHMLPC